MSLGSMTSVLNPPVPCEEANWLINWLCKCWVACAACPMPLGLSWSRLHLRKVTEPTASDEGQFFATFTCLYKHGQGAMCHTVAVVDVRSIMMHMHASAACTMLKCIYLLFPQQVLFRQTGNCRSFAHLVMMPCSSMTSKPFCTSEHAEARCPMRTHVPELASI